MRAFCITVDLDRDVNIQIPGNISAGSVDRGNGNSPRFDSTIKGLDILLSILEDKGVKATFFAEGRTIEKISADGLSKHEVGVHGYDHEDLTLMNEGELLECLGKAVRSVRDKIGRDPVSFRAPYMKINDTIIHTLPKLGIRYDSSMYAPLNSSIIPYEFPNGVTEVPVPEGRDRSGKKIVAYLWPMHEGKRKPEDYLHMASGIKEGVFVIATHTWHMIESRDKGVITPQRTTKNADNVRKIIEGMMGMGFEPMSIADAAKAYQR